jgi:type I restriction enzyme S subunit
MTTEPIDFKSDFKRPLPDGWRWVRLGEMCEFESGAFFSNKLLKRSGKYPVYGANGVIGYSDQFCFDSPRLVLGRVGSCGAVNTTEGPSWITDNTIVLRPNPDLDFLFISHYLKTVDFNKLRSASIQPLLTQACLKPLEIPLPPLSEQKRIAAILSEQMEAVQKAREATQAQLEAAKILLAAYLRQVFPLTGAELPEGWQWMKLGVACEKNTGTRDPLMKPDKSFLYVDITSVDNIKKAIGTTKIIQGKYSPSRARKVIYKRDVIISTTRPNLNAVAMVPSYLDNQICSTGFCVLRATSELDCDYLFLFVKNAQFVENLSRLVTGALYPAVTDKQVFSEFIPLPPLSEQKRIAAILNERMEAVGKARTALEAQMEHINALPASLLRRAFSGELQ